MSQEQDIKDRLRAWILQRNPKVLGENLLDSTPIIEQRIISSMDVLDLILFLEHLGGNTLDPTKLAPKSFHSLHAIYETFFGGGT